MAQNPDGNGERDVDSGPGSAESGSTPASTPRTISWLAGGWVVLVGCGFATMAWYEAAPGLRDASPAHWPLDVPFVRDADRLQLVVFLHPRCVCSRATLHELAAVAAEAGDRIAIRIVVPGPPTAAWKLDFAADVAADCDGTTAARFGAATSGHAFLFDLDGTCVFSGGITGSRGQVGDNLGRRCVVAALRGEKTGSMETPVFGCPLYAR